MNGLRLIFALIVGLSLLDAPSALGVGGGGQGAAPAASGPGDLRARPEAACEPGPGAAGTEAPRSAAPKGGQRAVITFPLTGGSDSTFRISAPPASAVVAASFQLEAQSVLPPAKERRCTLSDGAGASGWEGVTKDDPPTQGPGAFQQSPLDATAAGDVSCEDGGTHASITYGIGTPYQLYRFKVTEKSVSLLSLRWVGVGYDHLSNYTAMEIFFLNGGRWESVYLYTSNGVDTQLRSYSRTIASPQGYIDAGGFVHVLVMGLYGFCFSILETDYLALTVTGADPVWPTGLELDVGADGTCELSWPGEFRGTATVAEDVLKAPLQALIDLSGSGESVELSFQFSSISGGSVLLSNGSFDFDRPPQALAVPAEKCSFEEDAEAPGLLDLDACFRDDREATLRHEVFRTPEDGRIEHFLGPDGHRLGFRSSTRNWFGTREFGVRATDRSNLSATLYLNITVLPVNDAPALAPVPDQLAFEDSAFTLAVRATDVDDSPSNLSYSDDCPLFELDPRTGMATFVPANEHVGRYCVNVSVSDTRGAVNTSSFNLTIENTNDAPVLKAPDELLAREHERFEYTITATDIDACDELAYSVSSDIVGLEADLATGRMVRVFDDPDVGEHRLLLVATDTGGEQAKKEVRLVVENVNDPPQLSPVPNLTAVQGQYFEFQLTAFDPDRGEKLSFQADWKGLEVEASTGLLSFTPSNDDVGEHRFRISVRDASGTASEQRVNLTVGNVNDPPCDVRVLSPRDGASFRRGDLVFLTGEARDPDRGDALNYTWKEGSKVLGWGPSIAVRPGPGRHRMTLEVSDGNLSTSASIEMSVADEAGAAAGFGQLAPGGAVLGSAAACSLAVWAGAKRMRKRRGGKREEPRPPPGNRPGPPPAGQDRAPAPDGAGASPAPSAPPPVNGFGASARSPEGAPAVPPEYAAYSRLRDCGGLLPPNASGYRVAGPPAGLPPSPPLPQPPQPFPVRPGVPHGMGPHQAPPARGWYQVPDSGRWVLSEPLEQCPPAGLPPFAQAGPGQGHVPGGGNLLPMPPPPPGFFQVRSDFQGPAGPPFAGPEAGPWPGTVPGLPERPEDLSRDPGGCGPGPAAGQRPANGRERPDPGPPAPEAARRSSGGGPREDDGAVTREEVRTAIGGAKEAVRNAREAGLDVVDCDRLISEALAASYRLDYQRARNLARKAAAVARSLAENELPPRREEEE